MGKKAVMACVCDVCGLVWWPGDGVEPKRCRNPKCKSARWNKAGDASAQRQVVLDGLPASVDVPEGIGRIGGIDRSEPVTPTAPRELTQDPDFDDDPGEILVPQKPLEPLRQFRTISSIAEIATIKHPNPSARPKHHINCPCAQCSNKPRPTASTKKQTGNDYCRHGVFSSLCARCKQYR
jgi:hypothetical protein